MHYLKGKRCFIENFVYLYGPVVEGDKQRDKPTRDDYRSRQRVGATLADAFARQGYDLVLHANSSIDLLEANAAPLRALGIAVDCYACDFNDRDATQQFADTVIPRHGVDVLINNASLFQNDRLPNVSDASMEAHMNVNFHAPRMLMTRLYLDCQERQREGHIINLLDHKLRILTQISSVTR